MTSGRSPQGLLGRRDECRVVDDLLVDVRSGRSVTLVLRGEAGIGKTAPLEYVQRSASNCTIAKAVGIESEMELAFGGLHQLCTPFQERLGRLPAPQRDALETAFGLTPGTPPDRFLVGLAVLGLLVDVAEERPLVCIVDGWPREMRGVAAEAEGLFFCGLSFQYAFSSMLLAGAGRDADLAADRLAARIRQAARLSAAA